MSPLIPRMRVPAFVVGARPVSVPTVQPFRLSNHTTQQLPSVGAANRASKAWHRHCRWRVPFQGGFGRHPGVLGKSRQMPGQPSRRPGIATRALMPPLTGRENDQTSEWSAVLPNVAATTEIAVGARLVQAGRPIEAPHTHVFGRPSAAASCDWNCHGG